MEAGDIKDGDSIAATSSVALQRIVRACQNARPTAVDNKIALKVILATHAGFLSRDDILSLRMVDCPHIETVIR